MDDTLRALREEYAGTPLSEREVDADPVSEFRRWFDEAVRAEIPLANGMTLATADERGRPSARVVLLKQVDAQGRFVFFTSYESRKGRELAENPEAALVFWWPALHRQVRVEGRVEPVEAEISDQYFRERPSASNVSAVASPQSQAVASREELEGRVADVLAAHPGGALERPASWGGYRLAPRVIELWQGREDRLHDRLRYRLEGGGWHLERLAP
jgi:pyridoxamine 5'-phosphate oxidase